MTEVRKVTVRIAGNRSLQAVRDLNEEATYLRNLLAHATEFTFRPDFGDLNDEFSDDPESRHIVVLSWRGPSERGGDPDRWAVMHHGYWCWSRSKREFEYEPRPSERDDDFFADHRFTLDEAVAMVPDMLLQIQAARMPELKQMVDARVARRAER